jgi:uncharacterized protein YigE (DUF2233 family)
VDRALWTEKSACLAKHVEWKTLKPGLEAGEIDIERRDTTGTKIILVRIDPEKYGFKVIGEPGPGKAIEALVRESGCLGGINGGYFYYKNDNPLKRFPLGLTIRGGTRIAKYRKNYSGCFFASKSGPGMTYRKPPPGRPENALQSFPMLIYKGRIPDLLKKENRRKLNIRTRHRRAGIGTGWDGRILWLMTDGKISFFETAFLCGALGFRDCLSLDGGGSCQMAVFAEDTLRVPGTDRIPIAIGIFEK